MVYFLSKSRPVTYRYVYRSRHKSLRKQRLVSGLFLIAGFVLMLLATLPTLGWRVANFIFPVNLLSPVVSPVSASEFVRPQNFTDVTTWFVDKSEKADWSEVDTDFFFVTIPSLGIDRATVKTGGTDLSKNLIAWPGGAKPGTNGSVIIFGHSALPIFYNRNSYKTIFTKLFDLSSGDKIYLDYNGVRYQYVIEGKKLVKPDDFSILDQRFDAGKIRLVTCMPPGSYALRGVVTAKLVL